MIYLDTSILMPLFREELVSTRVAAMVGRQPPGSLAISLWTRVEFASVIAREVRIRALEERAAGLILSQFNAIASESFHVLAPTVADFELAHEFVTNFATRLRGPDALHLAIARNAGVNEVLSLDAGLLQAAKRLKIKARMGIRV